LLADVIDPIVMEGLALAVLEAVTREYHDDPAHAGRDVPGDHRAARDAVIDEYAGAGRLEAKHYLLAGTDQCQIAAALCPGRRVEVDIVRHRVACKKYGTTIWRHFSFLRDFRGWKMNRYWNLQDH
jgi:hypothetical protein